MEERVEISMLMDLYGELLTDKQKDIMELYFNEDLSLAEISELTKTSRQAIYDIIKRCHKTLQGYEERLGLLNKSLKSNEIKMQLLKMIEKNIEESKSYNELLCNVEDMKKFVEQNL